MSSLPNAALASCFALDQFFLKSFRLNTALIPFPPPPAEAFIMTGNPILTAILKAISTSSTAPPDPGIVGTFAFCIVDTAVALSPIFSIISGDGPINFILCSPQIFENLAFSDKNPYPGCIASAFVISAAAIIFDIFK